MRPTRRARDLGQNFLVDRNLLDVIERLAELSPDDTVLEIGGGSGVLSERLAGRARYVHVVEVDPALAESLREGLAPHDNVALHVADALELDLRSLEPAPGKVIANLPYGIAATVILRTIEELPDVVEWVVMVQREVGERLAAAPGTRAYGAPSVLAQLACEVRVLRPVSRTVFRPQPNVDSVLLGMTRRSAVRRGNVERGNVGSGNAGRGNAGRGNAPGPGLRQLVHDSFAHRRKTLAGSLALAPEASAGIRERAQAALEAIGHRPDERAERLSPEDFRRLGAELGIR